jgi:hypothetical protein
MQTFFEFIGKFAVLGVISAIGKGAKKPQAFWGPAALAI